MDQHRQHCTIRDDGSPTLHARTCLYPWSHDSVKRVCQRRDHAVKRLNDISHLNVHSSTAMTPLTDNFTILAVAGWCVMNCRHLGVLCLGGHARLGTVFFREWTRAFEFINGGECISEIPSTHTHTDTHRQTDKQTPCTGSEHKRLPPVSDTTAVHNVIINML